MYRKKNLEDLLLTDFVYKEVDELVDKTKQPKFIDIKVKTKYLEKQFSNLEKIVDLLYGYKGESPKITYEKFHVDRDDQKTFNRLINFALLGDIAIIPTYLFFSHQPQSIWHFLPLMLTSATAARLNTALGLRYLQLKRKMHYLPWKKEINLPKVGGLYHMQSVFVHEYAHHIAMNNYALDLKLQMFEDGEWRLFNEGFARSSTRYVMKLYSSMVKDKSYEMVSRIFDHLEILEVKRWQDAAKNEGKKPEKELDPHASGNALFLILEKYFGLDVSKKIYHGDFRPLEIFY